MNQMSWTQNVERMGLARPDAMTRFPYAWPNRNAPTRAVLASALMYPRFKDLVRFSLEHGTDTLRDVLRDLVQSGAMPAQAAEELERTLDNIACGISRHREAREHA